MIRDEVTMTHDIKHDIGKCLSVLKMHNIQYIPFAPQLYHIYQDDQVIGYMVFNDTVSEIREMSLYMYGGFVLRSQNVLNVNAAISKEEREKIMESSFTIFGETYTYPEVSPKRTRKISKSHEDERYEWVAQKKLIVLMSVYFHAIRYMEHHLDKQLNQLPWHVVRNIVDHSFPVTEHDYKIQYTTALEGMCNAPLNIPSLTFKQPV